MVGMHLVTVVSGFFFEAEDGLRDIGVTGVQTCALPIYRRHHRSRGRPARMPGAAVRSDQGLRARVSGLRSERASCRGSAECVLGGPALNREGGMLPVQIEAGGVATVSARSIIHLSSVVL